MLSFLDHTGSDITGKGPPSESPTGYQPWISNPGCLQVCQPLCMAGSLPLIVAVVTKEIKDFF